MRNDYLLPATQRWGGGRSPKSEWWRGPPLCQPRCRASATSHRLRRHGGGTATSMTEQTEAMRRNDRSLRRLLALPRNPHRRSEVAVIVHDESAIVVREQRHMIRRI